MGFIPIYLAGISAFLKNRTKLSGVTPRIVTGLNPLMSSALERDDHPFYLLLND